MRSWMLPAAVTVVVVALVATTAGLVVQTRRADDARARAAALDAEVAALQGEVRALERRLDEAERAGTGPLDGLLEDAPGGLEDLLGGLLGDGGGRELFDGLLGDDGDLLGGMLGGAGGIPGAACLTPTGDAGVGDLLGGLFGGSTTMPDDPDELVAVIAEQVADLRELAWQEEVQVDFLDDEQLRARLDELLSEDEDPVADDAERRLLEALGAVPAGTDLTQLRRDLLDDQVAGFYSPETGELVVRVPSDGRIRPIDRITVAHELEHALADQVLGLPDLEAFDGDADGALATLAVVEGDATLVMNLWALEHVSLTDQLGAVLGGDLAAAQASLDAIPHHLQRELLFPYTDGLDLICDRYLDGGWGAVDAAYDAELPTTTAEVLYGADARPPAAPAAPATPAGYDEVLGTTFGAAPLSWLFEAPGGDPERALDAPGERAAVWAGGRATVWADGHDSAVVLALVDGGGGPPLCASVDAWYAAAFPDASRQDAEGAAVFVGDTTAVLRCDGDDVVLGSAPDLVTATRIVSD
jgi:hypothetical protein